SPACPERWWAAPPGTAEAVTGPSANAPEDTCACPSLHPSTATETRLPWATGDGVTVARTCPAPLPGAAMTKTTATAATTSAVDPPGGPRNSHPTVNPPERRPPRPPADPHPQNAPAGAVRRTPRAGPGPARTGAGPAVGPSDPVDQIRDGGNHPGGPE